MLIFTGLRKDRDMKQNFIKTDTENLKDNVFSLIGNDWMLITAGEMNSWNTMTASWGQLGIMWNLPVSVCYIRPQRYTAEFVEQNEFYTLSFFSEQYRNALKFCGSRSGRDYDKAKETGLSPMQTENGSVAFEQARLILECRKLYTDVLKKESFASGQHMNRHYPNDDFHRIYMGEIVNSWINPGDF